MTPQPSQGVTAPFDFLPAEPWSLDEFSLEDSGAQTKVRIRGWAFSDGKLNSITPGRFLLNGRLFHEIAYPLSRPDVAKVFWQRRHAELSGFECASSVPTSALYPDHALELTFINPGPPRRVAAQQSWFKFDPSCELLLPDATRRFRVIGSNDEEHFTRGGFTDFKRLDAAIRFFTGEGFASGKQIMDFGCGCGRVARYLSHLPGLAFSGIDIDADNVAWCAENLSGSYAACPVRPPTSLPANHFDLVYGVSVFTHLREHMQDAWLAELARICAPGAFLFMTVHGQTALHYAWQGPVVFWRLDEQIRQQGIYVSDSNHQLDGYVEQLDEYVNVFHDSDYIRARWSAYFDIVDILPGYIYTHDLVVMRKRA